MKPYKVTITELLQTTVTVDANSQMEAERLAEKRWRASEYVLTADDFKRVAFSADIRDNHDLWQSVHDYESQLNIPPEDSLVEMNKKGLLQWEAKDGVTPEQIENAYTYLSEFALDRADNSVNVSAVDKLCRVYSKTAVLAILSSQEKGCLQAYVDNALVFSETPIQSAFELCRLMRSEQAEPKKTPEKEKDCITR